MDYENTQIKLDALIGYFNEKKINLSPVFQRGRAWNLPMRRELIKNIVRKRPIPAIFLYKEESESRFSYNILDGKQRLESILLFIADKNPKLPISTWKDYIFDRQYRRQAGFKVKAGNGQQMSFGEFQDDAIRDLREYQLALIEIKLGEETNLDEIINLFVDINQRGARVTRLQIVKALKRDDPFLKSVYALVAEKQPRYKDVHVVVKKGTVPSVLGKLSAVSGAADKTAKADRMWGKLMELALFVRNENKHGKGADVLKKFTAKEQEQVLTSEERKKLRRVFTFLGDTAYKNGLGDTRIAKDYGHFYIMATSLLSGDLLPKDADGNARLALAQKLTKFGQLLEVKSTPQPDGKKTDMESYIELSARQTTDAKKRGQRQVLFEKIIKTL